MRVIVLWGIYWDPPVLGNSKSSNCMTLVDRVESRCGALCPGQQIAGEGREIQGIMKGFQFGASCASAGSTSRAPCTPSTTLGPSLRPLMPLRLRASWTSPRTRAYLVWPKCQGIRRPHQT